MTHGPLSWRELVERDKQKSEDARGQIKRAAMPVQADPVAWMYEGPAMLEDGTIIQDRKCFPLRQIYKPSGWTETPLYAHPPTQWQGIESAPRDGKAVLLWVPADDGWDAYVASGWYESGAFDRRWYAAVDENPLSPQPTHWMPLPTPPAGGSDAE